MVKKLQQMIMNQTNMMIKQTFKPMYPLKNGYASVIKI